jgi:hypothetical protein
MCSQKKQQRSSLEQSQSNCKDADAYKTSTLDKIKRCDENTKTVPDSPGISVPDLANSDSAQSLAQTGEVTIINRTSLKYRSSNGYINGTFYQL